jgi:hypothetical protein
MRIRCITLWDITRTNINARRHHIVDDSDLMKKARQHSNYETIIQCIGIRAQPENITEPVQIQLSNHTAWAFNFTVDRGDVYSNGSNQLSALLEDCNNVPMISGLDETATLSNVLDSGSEGNIFFEIVDE